jgi:Pectinacetylesterase
VGDMPVRLRWVGAVLGVAALLGGCTGAPSPAPTPPAVPSSTPPTTTPQAALPEEWQRIEPGGDTTCARGTPYAFWVRGGKTGRLLIFFQGGGGCWDAQTCGIGSTWFDDQVGEQDSPARQIGIFDLANAENPFRDWNILYVPYCTGDVHAGDRTVSYRGPDGTVVVIQHRGAVNTRAALQWMAQRLRTPERIFVSGCSAGSIASIVHTPTVREFYPTQPLVQLGDSEAFVFDHPVNVADYGPHFPQWALDAGVRPDQFVMSKLYRAVASHYADCTFAQYNTAHDVVQQRFYDALSQPGAGRWEDALAASMDDIHRTAPNFRTYIAPGTAHCALPFGRFYTETVSGVRLRDWVAQLAEGHPVGSVHCDNCPP